MTLADNKRLHQVMITDAGNCLPSFLFLTISTRTDVLKYSFFPRTVIGWNHLD